MIRFSTGDLFDEDVEALVNAVNCVGVIGRGISLQFKERFPANFRAYASACHRDQVRPEIMFVFKTGQPNNPRYIINFPAKRHWNNESLIADIEAGLDSLADLIRARKITSIAVPPLGSGLGSLNWTEVRPRIERSLGDLKGVEIIVFEPHDQPSRVNAVPAKTTPTMTPGRAALIGLMDRFLRGLFEPYVTLLEIHELMYFMQCVGEQLNLRYVKGPYGPYAENLLQMLNAIDGHFISGYLDGGDDRFRKIEPKSEAVDRAKEVLDGSAITCAHFDKVVDLIEGFETDESLELLSTVHWVLVHEATRPIDKVIRKVHGWDDRKKRFSRGKIQLAADVLKNKGWL